MECISNIIQRHNLQWEGPNPNFFERMLLGNEDIGVCVTVRPDGIDVCIRVEEPRSAYIEIRELNSLKIYQNLIDSPLHHWIEKTRYYVSVLSNNVNEMKFVIRILPLRETKEVSGL